MVSVDILFSAKHKCNHLVSKSQAYHSALFRFLLVTFCPMSFPDKKFQNLPEECKSLKVNRLFLFMDRKANHWWVQFLNLCAIDPGSGDRGFVRKDISEYKTGQSFSHMAALGH